MNANKAKAPRASSNKIHITAGYPRVVGTRWMPASAMGLMALLAVFLTACSTSPRSGGDTNRSPSAAPGPSPSVSAVAGGIPLGERAERGPSVWVRVGWEELPGFQDDPVGEVMSAFLAGCTRSPTVWSTACEQATRLNPQDHHAVRLWMLQHLQPWRIEDRSGVREGLLTGYYEPHFEARRQADGDFKSPLHRPPADLGQRRPYWTRQQLDTVREARDALKGRELVYLRDPVDVLVLQIQGSGRLTVTEPDGRQRQVRLGFTAHNDHPFGSVGRWLIDQGHLSAAQATWPGIKEWMQRNPRRVQEALWKNPRVVFFKEEPLTDPDLGPRGAMGVPLTPQRSLAVDPRSVPYGTALWIHSHSPNSKPLQRAVMAQDTGSAITGAVRGDYFWGWGDEAGERAGRTKGRLQMWALWPAGQRPPP
ncbi:MAG: MltA domain-containing protein [Burkholderiales bacterium]|nr:MltA domain-containing protein [Burkholderiales bacterium]